MRLRFRSSRPDGRPANQVGDVLRSDRVEQLGRSRQAQVQHDAEKRTGNAQTGGDVTHFVAGLGTTGTFIGTSARLKALNPRLFAVAVQPASALHGLEGLKHLPTAIVPGIYDDSIPDETLFISTEDAYDNLAWLARHAGIAVGPSSGAAYAACLQLARRLARQPAASEACIVTVFPDAGERYIAEGLIGGS